MITGARGTQSEPGGCRPAGAEIQEEEKGLKHILVGGNFLVSYFSTISDNTVLFRVTFVFVENVYGMFSAAL